MQKFYNLFYREDGQTMAEYGVVLAVITIAVFGALALLAGNITNALTRVAGYITSSSPARTGGVAWNFRSGPRRLSVRRLALQRT